MADFEIITAPGSDMQMLNLRSVSTNGDGWNGLLRNLNSSQPGYNPIAENGSYSRVAVVYTCARIRADAMASMPLRCGTSNDEILDSGPLVELVEEPSPRMTQRRFWRDTEMHLCLFGRAFWWIQSLPNGQPVSVKNLHPMRMTARVDGATGELQGWTYRPPGSGRELYLSIDEVHAVIDPDFETPDQPFEGLSPRAACAMAISQYYTADVANQASLNNGSAPDFMLRTDQVLNENQRGFMREQLEERISGPANRRRPMIGDGGLEAIPFPVSYSDMEFVELKRMNRVDICAVFNVPPAVAGFYEDSNYAHASAAEESFWTRSMIPHASWLSEEFELAVVRRFEGNRALGMTKAIHRAMTPRERTGRYFGKASNRSAQRKLYVWFDASSIPAVQNVYARVGAAATPLVAAGVPLGDYMDAHDLPYKRHDWMNTWFKPFGLMDVQEDTAGLLDGPTGPGPADLDEDPSKSHGRPTGHAKGCSHGNKSSSETRELNDAQKMRIWQLQRMSYAPLEIAYASKVKKHFNELRKETLANLERVAPRLKAVSKDSDVIGEILFDLFDADNQLATRVRPLVRNAIRLGGEQAMTEAAQATGADKPNPFNINDPYVQDKIKQQTQAIARVNHTLRRQISETLAQGVSQNETTFELAERVRKNFNMAGKRAKLIAQNEVGRSVEESRQLGRTQAGTPMKSWLWSRKETGRPWHFDTETETMNAPVPNESKFRIADTGSEAMAPRLSGVAKDDINCGCTALARYPNDEIRSVLNRYETRGFLTWDQLVKRDTQPSHTKEGRNDGTGDQ